MNSVTSNAVYNYLREGNLRFSWIKLNPDNPNFGYVIPQYSIHRSDGVENKTVVISIKISLFAINFNIQLSYGDTDPIMQQMSGVGRVWFEEIKDNTTPDGQDGSFKYYNRRIFVPQGSKYFGIGTNTTIGILDLHSE